MRLEIVVSSTALFKVSSAMLNINSCNVFFVGCVTSVQLVIRFWI